MRGSRGKGTGGQRQQMEESRGERQQTEGRRFDRGKQVEVWTREGGGKRKERISRKGEAEGKRH